MSHPIEIAVAIVVTAALAVGTMFAVQPRPKPEPEPPPIDRTLEQCESTPDRMCIVRAEAQPEKTEDERARQIEKDIGALDAKQKALIERVNQVLAEERKK